MMMNRILPGGCGIWLLTPSSMYVTPCSELTDSLARFPLSSVLLPLLLTHNFFAHPLATQTLFGMQFQQALDSESAHMDLVVIFVDLLCDTEAEVRCAAAGKVLAFSKAVPATQRVRVVQQSILPCLNVCYARRERRRSRSLLKRMR